MGRIFLRYANNAFAVARDQSLDIPSRKDKFQIKSAPFRPNRRSKRRLLPLSMPLFPALARRVATHTKSSPCLLGAPPMTPRPSPPLASPSLRVSAPPRALRPPFRRSPVFGEFYIHRATFRSARIRARALDSIALRHKRGENNGRSSVVTRNLGLHAIQRTRVLSDPAHSRPFGDPRSSPIPEPKTRTKNPNSPSRSSPRSRRPL